MEMPNTFFQDAKWITGQAIVDDDKIIPPYHFLKKIVGDKCIRSALIYATALGCYCININGKLLSQQYFSPGYTQYNKRLLYQTYDATEILSGKRRVFIDAEVAGGWYSGRLGLSLKGNRYGKKRAFLLSLHLTFQDGSTSVIETDETWFCSADGPRRFASFFDGEIYDANREDFALWNNHPVRIYDGKIPTLEPDYGCPVIRHQCLTPVDMFDNDDGEQIICFDRNIAGVIQLKNISADRGCEIVIRHGEILSDGKLNTKNLRTAKAEIRYVCKDGIQSYCPQFTYMGFQYVSVCGIKLSKDQICAWELYSDMDEVGNFLCSDDRVNRLWRNICTSQKSNFIDIPTDCPQRDERCGWTGDIAVFAPMASFYMDTESFLRKWCRDVVLCQENGIVPMTVPDGAFGQHGIENRFGLMHKGDDALWGDAIVLVPWAVFQSTGDVTILRECYQGMKDWIKYEERQSLKPFNSEKNRYIWSWGFHFGDWLAPGDSTFRNMKKAKWTATAYFAHSACLVGQVAEILGEKQDSVYYKQLYQNIRAAFQRKFIDKDGHIKHGFQSAYALALQFGLLNDNQAKTVAADLNRDVIAHDYHLTTGFAGTPALLFALSDKGYVETAYKLLLQESCPGWLYPVCCGATSIWERWDALRSDGTVNVGRLGNMVSFNHYAYGTVGEWLYRRMCGLEITSPGYRTMKIAPMIGDNITQAMCSHKTPYGVVSVQWHIKENLFYLEVQLPGNTEAEIVLPNGKKECRTAGTWQFECAIDCVT